MFSLKLKTLEDFSGEKFGLSDRLSDEEITTVYGGCSLFGFTGGTFLPTSPNSISGGSSCQGTGSGSSGY